jgi:O-antigen/teichoic acid export membrane protein
LNRLKNRRPTGHRHLLTGSAVLVVGAGIQAVTGALFWLVAAHLDLKTDVGKATALYTSTLFGAYLAGLGLPVMLARYAADRSEESNVVFSWSALTTVVWSLVCSLAYVGVLLAMGVDAAKELTDFNPVLGPLLFAVMVAGAALSLIVDVRCMTVRRWNLVVVRIALVGFVRIPLLFLFRGHAERPLWLFVFAAGTTALSGVLGAIWITKVTGGRHALRPRPSHTRAAIHYTLVNYVSTLGYQAPYFALPVIVLASVSANTNATFYVAWGIVSVVFYVPSAIGQALLAEGGKDGAQVKAQTRLALALTLGLMLVGTAAAFLFSGLVTKVYGEQYAGATRILPAMMAAGIPWAITSIELTEARVRHRSVVTVLITVVLTVSIIVPALILVPGTGAGHGLDGAAKAWLFGNIFAAVVAVIVSRVRRPQASAHQLEDPILAANLAETIDVRGPDPVPHPSN